MFNIFKKLYLKRAETMYLASSIITTLDANKQDKIQIKTYLHNNQNNQLSNGTIHLGRMLTNNIYNKTNHIKLIFKAPLWKRTLTTINLHFFCGILQVRYSWNISLQFQILKKQQHTVIHVKYLKIFTPSCQALLHSITKPSAASKCTELRCFTKIHQMTVHPGGFSL